MFQRLVINDERPTTPAEVTVREIAKNVFGKPGSLIMICEISLHMLRRIFRWLDKDFCSRHGVYLCENSRNFCFFIVGATLGRRAG
jgi:hypothetical protein